MVQDYEHPHARTQQAANIGKRFKSGYFGGVSNAVPGVGFRPRTRIFLARTELGVENQISGLTGQCQKHLGEQAIVVFIFQPKTGNVLYQIHVPLQGGRP